MSTSTGSTNLKSVGMNFDPPDVAFLEGGQHVQDWVEAAPPVETEVKMTHFCGFFSPAVHSRANLSNCESKHLC